VARSACAFCGVLASSGIGWVALDWSYKFRGDLRTGLGPLVIYKVSASGSPNLILLCLSSREKLARGLEGRRLLLSSPLYWGHSVVAVRGTEALARGAGEVAWPGSVCESLLRY
jgi:hypothetical protein